MTAARVDWKLQRARCINQPLPFPLSSRAARKPPRAHAARDPNGATGGCDGPDAAHRRPARSVATRLDGACRDRPTAHEGVATGNHVSTLVSSPSWCVSSAAPVRPTTHARYSVFSPSLSISLCLSFLLLPPRFFPPTPRSRAFLVVFLFFFLSQREFTGELAGVGLAGALRDHVAPRLVCVRGRAEESGGVCFSNAAREIMLPRGSPPRASLCAL